MYIDLYMYRYNIYTYYIFGYIYIYMEKAAQPHSRAPGGPRAGWALGRVGPGPGPGSDPGRAGTRAMFTQFSKFGYVYPVWLCLLD